MKLLIAGSRGITNFDISRHIPDGVDTIISGGAPGIDTIAENYADRHNLSKYILRPRYEIYGRFAPLKRNEEIIANPNLNRTRFKRRIFRVNAPKSLAISAYRFIFLTFLAKNPCS